MGVLNVKKRRFEGVGLLLLGKKARVCCLVRSCESPRVQRRGDSQGSDSETGFSLLGQHLKLLPLELHLTRD